MIELKPWIQLSTIVARRPPTRLLCFENDGVDPLLGEMQRRRKSGKPATDDRYRHCPVDV